MMYMYNVHCRAGRKGALLGPVSVHAWYGSSSKVIIAIWKMARDQHMFYRSKRTTRVSTTFVSFSKPYNVVGYSVDF